VVTAVSFYRRRAPWLYSVAQIVSTLGLLAFIAGHWRDDVRYLLGGGREHEVIWLLIFLLVLMWESFFLGQRLTLMTPRLFGDDALQARTEVLILLVRGLLITPAMVFGAAFVYRIWF
jgi:hypothetical protein